jgi:hypothetical protein
MTNYPAWMLLVSELWCGFCGFWIGRGIERRRKRKVGGDD